MRKNTQHRVMADRIESATYLCACAAAGGKITVEDTEPSYFASVTQLLEESGCELQVGADRVTIQAPGRCAAWGRCAPCPTRAFPQMPSPL